MGNLPSFLPDPWDEVALVGQWQAAAQDATKLADTFTVESLQRLNRIAQLGPNLGPMVIPLAQAGVDPENDPLIEFTIKQQALMQRSQQGLGMIGTMVRPLAGTSHGTPRSRLRNSLQAANAAGLIGADGKLREPETTNPQDPARYIFEQVRHAHMGAEKELDYIDASGAERRLHYSRALPTPSAATGNLGMAHRMLESADMNTLSLREQGLDTLTNIVNQHPDLQPYLDMATSLGLVDGGGFLIDPNDDNLGGGQSAPSLAPETGFVNDKVRRDFFRQLEDVLNSRGLDMPYQTATGGEVRTAEGPWEDAGPQIDVPAAPTPSRGSLASLMGAADTPGLAGPEQASLIPGFDRAQETFRRGAQIANVATNAPLQELQGQIRNAYSALHGNGWQSGAQSDLLIGGNPLTADYGGGFGVDPTSEIARQRARAEQARGQIDGHSVTLGRWVAQPLGEAGDAPYDVVSGLVDFGVAVFGDPSSWALGALGKGMQARRLFQAADAATSTTAAAGAFRGLTRWTDGPTAEAFLNSSAGTQIVDRLATTTSPSEIMRRSGWKIPADVAVTIASESDSAVIRETLRPLLGTTFRRTDEVWRASLPRRVMEGASTPSSRRLNARVPGRTVPVNNRTEAMQTLGGWADIVRMDPDLRDGYLDRYAMARSETEMRGVVQDMMSDTAGILEGHGITNERVRQDLTRMWSNSHDESRKWFQDEVGSDVDVWDYVIHGGTMHRVGTARPGHTSPHLITETLANDIPLPDIDAIRRVTSNKALRFLTTKHTIWNTSLMEGEMRTPWLAIQSFQDAIWKPVTLARPAWTVRVVGEEQARMSAAGLDSMFNHPLSWIAYRLGRKGDNDVFGTAVEEAEQHKRTVFNVRGQLLEERPNTIRSQRWTLYDRDEPGTEYMRAWARELLQVHNDPISRQVARNGIDFTLDWLEGAGRNFRRELTESSGVDLTNRTLARRYLETVAERIRVKTGGDSDLLDLIRTGKLRGRNIVRRDGLYIDRRFTNELGGYMHAAPKKVKGEETLTARNASGPIARMEEAKNRAVDYLFAQLMSQRTNNLSRSPAFRQYYWQRMTELAPYADDANELRTLFDNAANTVYDASSRRNPFSIRRRRQFGYNLTNRAPVGNRLSIDELDTLAKDYALQNVQKLLFDVSQKQNWEEAAGMIAPFISAWKEVFTSWTRLTMQNPSIPRRFAQGVDAAHRSGFFFEDENGETVFTYPGSEFLTRTLMDVPIPLTGRAEGLNFMAQIVPGIGPAMQIPAVYLLADKPQFREWYEALVPFGAPSEEGGAEGADIFNYAPPYFKRLWQSFNEGNALTEQDQRTYNNTIGQVARYLASTGEYDLEDQGDWQRMLEDARSKARMFFLIRGLAQGVAPSAPAPRFMIMDRAGDLLPIAALTEEYRGLQDADFETADEEFLRRHGDQVVLAMTPFSKTLSWGLDPSLEFHEWEQANEDLRTNYPSVYGLFGPRGKFDISVFGAQFADDQREQLSPDEWTSYAQHMIASRQYEMYQAEVGEEHRNTAAGRAYLRDRKQDLREMYPGYLNFVGQPGGVEPVAAMIELNRIVDEPQIRNTPLGRAVQEYLTNRDEVLSYYREAEDVGITAEVAEPGRMFLTDLAGRLIGQTPDFERIYDMVLSRELEMADE